MLLVKKKSLKENQSDIYGASTMNLFILPIEFCIILVLIGLIFVGLSIAIYAYLRKDSKLVMKNQPVDFEQMKKYKKVYDQKTNTYVLRAEMFKTDVSTDDESLIG